MRAALSSFMRSVKCPYRSRVKPALACPRLPWMVLVSSPARMALTAYVCRRSWKRTPSRPVFFARRRKAPSTSRWLRGPPIASVKTRLLELANRADYNNLSGQEAAAIREKVRMEHLCDVLLHGSSEEQQKLFKDREDVKALIDRILHPRP